MSKIKIKAEFNGYLEKATSPLQLQPDMNEISKICKFINERSIDSYDAMEAVHLKILDENPHTIYFALEVLENIIYTCGNLVNPVIFTSEYMDLLNDVLKETKHKLIRDKILKMIQDWTEKFKHFPQYSAPKKLLEDLQGEGYVFPDLKEENTIDKSKKESINDKICSDTFNKKIKTDKSEVNSSELDNKDIKCDENNEFQQTMKAIQEEKKRKFKEYCKANGIATSSDEEDVNTSKECKEKSQEKNESEVELISKQLPKDMKKVKESRLRLRESFIEVKEMKRREFYDNMDNSEEARMQRALLKQSENDCCKKFQKKSEVEEEVRIPKRYPYEIRKILESKTRLKNEAEQLRKEKNESFRNRRPGSNNYQNKNPMRIVGAEHSINTNNILEDKCHRCRQTFTTFHKKHLCLACKQYFCIQCAGKFCLLPECGVKEVRVCITCYDQVNKLKRSGKLLFENTDLSEEYLESSSSQKGKGLTCGNEDEDEDFKRALLLSKNEQQRSLVSEKEQEEEHLRRALELSLLENGINDDVNELQQAINLSFEETTNNSCSMLSSIKDDDLALSFAMQLSLEAKEKNILDDFEDGSINYCAICLEASILKSFKPCDHRCICDSCAIMYTYHMCPICREHYTAIL